MSGSDNQSPQSPRSVSEKTNNKDHLYRPRKSSDCHSPSSTKTLLQSDVEIKEILGEGAFGKAFRCRVRIVGDLFVNAVVKYMKRDIDLGELNREYKMLHSIQGIRGVPTAYGIVETPRKGLAMSFNGTQTLGAYIRSQKVVDVNEFCGIMAEVARTMEELHDLGISHGDLHTGNIVIKWDDDCRAIPTVIDFGLATTNSDPRVIVAEQEVDVRRFAHMLQLVKLQDQPHLEEVMRLITRTSYLEGFRYPKMTEFKEALFRVTQATKRDEATEEEEENGEGKSVKSHKRKREEEEEVGEEGSSEIRRAKLRKIGVKSEERSRKRKRSEREDGEECEPKERMVKRMKE